MATHILTTPSGVNGIPLPKIRPGCARTGLQMLRAEVEETRQASERLLSAYRRLQEAGEVRL